MERLRRRILSFGRGELSGMALVKICGLVNDRIVDAALEAGADRIGLVLAAGSPRRVDPDACLALSERVAAAGAEPWIVASWTRDSGGPFPGFADFVAQLPPNATLQLHGHETPDDVGDARRQLGARRMVKAIGVAAPVDLEGLPAYREADAFLFDARPPSGAGRTGGFGVAFDWSLLQDVVPDRPWVLSGGLTPDNVAAAIAATGARAVDVSSGVESAVGVKDVARIRAFIQAAKAV
jgi:phosphoribosylanthranilate isomerase